MAAFRVLAGLLLLFLGRPLFWVFVAVLGFVVGLEWAAQLFPDTGEPMQLLVGVLVGIVGAVLASFFYQLAIAVAGFFAGGRLGIVLLTVIAPAADQSAWWLVFVLAGIIGAIVMLLIFDWALILMSSILGASLIAQQVEARPELSAILFVVLVIAGVVVQAGLMRRAARL